MNESILKALTSGFTAKQVIDFIIKKFPQHQEKIQTALSMGFNPAHILKQISGGRKEVNKKIDALTEHERTRQSEKQSTSRINQTALSLASTAVSPYVLSRALPKGVQAIAGLGNQVPSLQQAAQPLTDAEFTQASDEALAKQAEKGAPQDLVQDKEVSAEKYEALKKFKEQLKGKKGLKDQLQEDFDKQYGQPTEKVIEQISPEAQPMEQVQGNLVLTPQGDIGEVQSVKNGIATLNVDGKQKTRKEADLQEIPISQPDLATLYENLIQAIPEAARSSVINFAGYDADNNELIFRPHSGAAYVYKDIPPEFAEQLKNAMFKAKTTGENFYGSWSEGEGSRFAGLSQLIRELQKQYGGKGKEYVRKYQTLVDILGEPEKAKKEKHKAMMAKKKEERDAKKKRKPKNPS